MLRSIFARFKYQIFLASILSVASALLNLLMLNIVNKQIQLIGSDSYEDSKALLSFLIFVVSVFSALAFSFLSKYLLAKLSSKVVYEFRNTLVKRIFCTPYSELEKIGGHRILSSLKTDAAKISEGFLAFPGFIYSAVTVFLCLLYMLYLSVQLFALMIFLMFLVVVLGFYILRLGLKNQTTLRSHEDQMFHGLRALVDGDKELGISASRRRFFYKNILHKSFNLIRVSSVKVSVVFSMLESATFTLIFFVIGIVVFGSGYLTDDITSATVVGFVLVILYMVDPLENVIGSIDEFSDLSVSYKNVENLGLCSEDEFAERIEVKSHIFDQPWSTLAVKDIQFSYKNEDSSDYSFHIGPVSALFKKGEATFITGGNGSGKSTFAKLLVGLYKPDSGSVYIDTKKVSNDISDMEYQKMFSTIFSNFYLFDHVLNQVGELAGDDIIETYLEYLGMADKITSANGELSTLNLSQGQRKRLALMMAYIEDSPIFLFDEWAADQDPSYREIFYKKIIPEIKSKNKIVIIITHDDRYFHLADQLLKFEGGKLESCYRPNMTPDTEKEL